MVCRLILKAEELEDGVHRLMKTQTEMLTTLLPMRKRSYVVLDAIITDLETRFNDTAVGVLKSLSCLSPATLIEKDKDAPSEMCLA